jgi:hypothetical protein
MKRTSLAILLGAALCAALPLSRADEAAVLKPLPPLAEGRASIVYKSDGAGMVVHFASTTEGERCKGFTPVGKVYAAELLRKKLLGFVAKAVEKGNRLMNAYPQVDTVVAAEQTLQIRGYSAYSDSNGPFRTSGSCGPITTMFTPESMHRYQVVFNFVGEVCEQKIIDVTEPAQPQPVAAQPISGCTRP